MRITGFSMDLLDLFGFALLSTLVILVSVGLDRLFSHIIPFRMVYYTLRMPGIVLHELAHGAGCLVSGAKIRKMVLFSEQGGSVTYSQPKIPVFGSVIISTAPLLVLPLVLVLLTWLFSSFFGCYIPPVIPVAGNAPAGIYSMIAFVTDLFSGNIVYRLNGWFFVYLYLTGSIVLSLAPSMQDIKNAIPGIVIIGILCLSVTLSGFVPAIDILSRIISLLSTAFSIGLVCEITTAAASVPLIILYGLTTS